MNVIFGTMGFAHMDFNVERITVTENIVIIVFVNIAQ
jgi:hypothetical protein